MSLKEKIKREKAEMNPIRFRLNYYVCTAFVVGILLSVISIAVVAELAKPEWLCLIPAGVALALVIVLLIISAVVVKKEEKTELKRWAYLFKGDLVFEGETLETDDPETGIKYLLSQKGMKIILPKAEEQVFDEVKENEFFMPWSDAELVVASDNFARRVRLAFAVVDVSGLSVDGEYVPTDNEVHFLPLEESLVAFFRKYGLEEKLSIEWRYIQRQPLDAFRQILAWGYIRTMIGENGKRVKRENAEHLFEK